MPFGRDTIRHSAAVLPKLNHLFQTCETGAVSEYQSIEETMSPQVLELVTAWIEERGSEAGN